MGKIETGLHYPIKLDSLPLSWHVDYVGVFCQDIQSGFACGKHSDDQIGVPHLRPMNVSRRGELDFEVLKYVATDFDQRRLANGDVLFNNTNSPELIGKTAYVAQEGEGYAFSNHMTRLRFNAAIDARFGAYQLHFLWMTKYFLHGCVKHVNQASVSAGELGKSVPLVAPPVPEQHRIVAKIEELFSELDQGVASLKMAREQLKVYRQSLLKHAFEGKLTAAWRAAHADQLETAAALQQRITFERTERHRQQLADWQTNGQAGPKPKPPKPLPPLTPEELAELPELPAGWGWFRVEHLCDVVRGGSPRPAGDPKYYGGSIPFLKVADITRTPSPYLNSFTFTITDAGLTKTRQIEPHTLLLSNSGATLGVPKICLISATMNDGVAAFLGLPRDELLYHYYFWQSQTERLRNIDQGAAQPNLNTDLIKQTFIPVCSGAEQRALIEKLEQALSEADQLELTLATALQQAEALHQSILKKAFCGQLVEQDENDEPASALLERIRAEKAGQVRGKSRRHTPKPVEALELKPAPGRVIPFPVSLPGIAAKDLHAGILALAYRLHEQHPERLQHFGHVKAEKISHLVEAHLGLDLERQPFKDAAGPNDHPHLKKVEHRARMANWFAVTRQDSGNYVFHPKSGFDRLLTKTRQALGVRLAEVERLLELMLPMTMRQAEILATVYAAWNNLLLLGKAPSDEEIVTEARENWHESKLKIERDKFFTALNWMRGKGLVPSGQGRFVAAKGEV